MSGVKPYAYHEMRIFEDATEFLDKVNGVKDGTVCLVSNRKLLFLKKDGCIFPFSVDSLFDEDKVGTDVTQDESVFALSDLKAFYEERKARPTKDGGISEETFEVAKDILSCNYTNKIHVTRSIAYNSGSVRLFGYYLNEQYKISFDVYNADTIVMTMLPINVAGFIPPDEPVKVQVLNKKQAEHLVAYINKTSSNWAEVMYDMMPHCCEDIDTNADVHYL